MEWKKSFTTLPTVLKFVGGSVLLAIALYWLSKIIRSRNLTHQIQPIALTAIQEQINDSEYKELLNYVIAQAKHETSNFSSYLAKHGFNLFGMKVPKIRKSYANGVIAIGETEYSKYEDYQDSVNDYILYLRFVNFPLQVVDLNEFVQLMKEKKYFEDTVENYTNGMKRYL